MSVEVSSRRGDGSVWRPCRLGIGKAWCRGDRQSSRCSRPGSRKLRRHAGRGPGGSSAGLSRAALSLNRSGGPFRLLRRSAATGWVLECAQGEHFRLPAESPQALLENTGDDNSAARRSALRKPLPVACEGRRKAQQGACLRGALCPANRLASGEAAVPGRRPERAGHRLTAPGRGRCPARVTMSCDLYQLLT